MQGFEPLSLFQCLGCELSANTTKIKEVLQSISVSEEFENDSNSMDWRGIKASLKDSVYFLQKEKKDTFNLDPKK